jgi:glycosyltransferase involved in cell wall biosynthesis
MRHVVVMVTTSYPRFPGDGVGSFLEPISKSVAARGHEVHVVAPWHPAIRRPRCEDDVFFHFYRYAPTASLNVFGYGQGLRADTDLRPGAWLVAPLALAAGWFKARRVATKRHATVMHGHWVVPGGLTAALAAGGRPVVVSLHGSDVFVAERHRLARRAARAALARADWITACSDDLRLRAIQLGADPGAIETVPYGVDVTRFAPDANARTAVRHELGIGGAPLVFSAGRLVRKKGFEFLIDAVRQIRIDVPSVHLVIAGDGDLHDELVARIRDDPAIHVVGGRTQDDVGRLAAAADVVAIPSVHDETGNVDGLPNVALEAMATAAPVVASRVGGLPKLIEDGVTGRLVPERDVPALARVLRELLTDSATARRLGLAGRQRVARDFSWHDVAGRFVDAYDRASARLRALSQAAGRC